MTPFTRLFLTLLGGSPRYMNERNYMDMEGTEKAYTTMSFSGVANIVLGIIVIAVGVFAGTFTIVTGASLMRDKKTLTF